MAANGELHTIQQNHSVKEAVISFTVKPEIQAPSDYRKLLGQGSPLSDFYHQFEPVKTVEITMDVKRSESQIKTEQISGFKLIGFKNGKTSHVIQGLNQPNQGVFTFNTVDYTNWHDFKASVTRDANVIAKFKPTYLIKAISLLYIDEFYFESGISYNPNGLFNKDSRNLPEGILDAAFVDYNIVMRRNNSQYTYEENLSTKVYDEGSKKTIRIIENLTFPIVPVSFLELFNNESLSKILDFAHSENKSLLMDILNPDISKLIGL